MAQPTSVSPDTRTKERRAVAVQSDDAGHHEARVREGGGLVPGLTRRSLELHRPRQTRANPANRINRATTARLQLTFVPAHHQHLYITHLNIHPPSTMSWIIYRRGGLGRPAAPALEVSWDNKVVDKTIVILKQIPRDVTAKGVLTGVTVSP
jgi:hypothetical protein